MFLFTLLACSTLLPFNIHNRNISTDRKKDGVVYEVCQLWLRRIHCLNRIFTFHLLSTKASVPLKIGRSPANAAFGTGRNYRKFQLVKFVRPISFLLFPSRNVGGETPPPTCMFSSLHLA